jgi:branched-chain amino acid aminotransferase
MSTDIGNRLIWLGGKIVPLPEATINVLSPTSQFGANVFEGIRCYWNERDEQLYAFRLPEHYRRLKNSIRLLELEDAYSEEQLRQALVDVVRANGYREDIAVRQTVFVDGFGSWGSEGPVNMFVAPIPKAKTNPEYNKRGLHCCISSWQRIHDTTLSPRVKCGANYINSRMGQREALRNGYDTTIFLNREGTVSEGPGSCLFLVKDGVLVTPRLTDSVLESITRDTLLTLARKELHIPVEERSIDRTELYICDEAFLCGSAMEVTPIYSVDRHPIGETAGPVTAALRRLYLDCVTGERPEYRHWLTPIYD